MNRQISLILSGLVFTLTLISSAIGLTDHNIYSSETNNWRMQVQAQDLINLFLILPIIGITIFFLYKRNQKAERIWAGVMLYLIYTFLIYCFDIHFNRLFLLYCFCLCLSTYGFFYFLVKKSNCDNNRLQQTYLTKIIGIYLVLISIVFYFLWLSDIVPAVIADKLPQSLIDVGLFTNAVHVLDLSIFLPGIFIIGLSLLKGKPIGFIFAPVILAFLAIMEATIAIISIVLQVKGLETNIILIVIMSSLALFTIVLLHLYSQKDIIHEGIT